MRALSCAGVDLVVVAGDVHESFESIDFLERIDAPVLLVLGNHDYWRISPEPVVDMDDIVDTFRRRLAGGNVTLLERDEVVIGGVRFLGGTMWTDVAGLRPMGVGCGWALNDCRHILARKAWKRFFTGDRGAALLEEAGRDRHWSAHLKSLAKKGRETGLMNPLLHAFLHSEFEGWLEHKLSTPFDGPTVVVTHHAPSRRSIASMGLSEHLMARVDRADERPRFSEDAHTVCAATYYATSTESLLQRASGRVSLWIHGHVHADVDYAVGGVRVVCNPVEGRPDLANRGVGLD